MKFDTNTEGDDEFNFDDPQDFPVMSPPSQNFHLGCEISQNLLDELAQNLVQSKMLQQLDWILDIMTLGSHIAVPLWKNCKNFNDL